MENGSFQVDVSSLDPAQRQAFEAVIGHGLGDKQQLTIQISGPAGGNSDPRPPQRWEDWANFYEGLSDDEVEEIDQIIKTRANLTRNLDTL